MEETKFGKMVMGALMRMLPFSIFIKDLSNEEIISLSSQCSSLTHRHIRSQIVCSLYSILVKNLLQGKSFEKAYSNTLEVIRPYIQEAEVKEFSRILDMSIVQGERISSTGYVIHSLESSIYCLATTDSFKSAVLKAVNLGFDTDTTVAVTGGLAGIIYGYEGIPKEWLQVIVKNELIESKIEEFIQIIN